MKIIKNILNLASNNKFIITCKHQLKIYIENHLKMVLNVIINFL